jgi:predicted membrane-bound spermidine synthase
MFLSALLLFSVQPMFAKMALPALGGTPAVWAVSMCFFQAVLLAGYIYAHALNRWLEPRTAVLTHVVVLAFAALALPIGLPAAMAEPPSGDAYLWLLGVLALGVGLPFFAISANAPLLLAWFSKTEHRDASDPYFLYGASNLGSLLALLAYPIVLEPTLGLTSQGALWSFGFFALIASIVLCGGAVLLSGTATSPKASDARLDAAAIREPISWQRRAGWIALAAIPSGLMVAVTTYVTTDVGSAPFIWVVPLALYLTTFIMVFKDKLSFPYTLAVAVLPLAILAHILLMSRIEAVAFALLAYFLAALMCHRELYLRRPGSESLTDFYICMSAGGVIGGIFSALIAPQIFSSVLEFKLLLVISLLARPGVLDGLPNRKQAVRIALFAAGLTSAFVLYKTLVELNVLAAGGLALAALIGLVILGVYLTRSWPEHRVIIILTMVVGVGIVPTDSRTLYQQRSFFGTIRVITTEDGQYHAMLHGTTVHGAERVKTADGQPVTAAVPATYYHPDGPMARGVALARQIAKQRGAEMTTGVVGLGSGSLACYAKPSETWRYFELDPMIVNVARRPDLFTFLTRCLPNNDVVIGDARLTLQKESEAKFDYLVIDAFSSDSIPVHLLTREALEIYERKLAPGGVVAIHISNRFLELAPAVAATALSIPGLKGIYVNWAPNIPVPDATASRVVFLTKDSTTYDTLRRNWPEATSLDADGAAPWTDDYSNVLSTLIRGLTH